jgi:hypothetical protein
MKDKFVDDDFIVFNFKENDVKDDNGVHIYARPSLLKVCSYFIFSYFHFLGVWLDVGIIFCREIII